ncbi:MAG: flagellar motor switch protein FliG [Alphaproteobacteria bacterium]|nr:flagellar motor switch protein FliG [Alphaproteobacteria bacterium]MCB9928769.1 flagellar motor switch protein FliG [Alphaproteobacteria bacterium]
MSPTDPTDPTEPSRNPLALVSHRPLAPDEKAAVVVYSMGEERAEKLLSRMDESDYRRFARAMNRLGPVDAATVDAVLGEFAVAVGDGAMVRGGTTETRRFLTRFLEEGQVDQIMQEIGGPSGRDVWEKLSNTPEQTLYAYLRNEQPQSAAVILSRIRPEKAARVLQLFPEGKANEIILRISRTGTIDRRIMAEVKATLQDDLLAALKKQQTTRQPHDVIGNLLNQMPPDRAAPILNALQDHDPDLAGKVQKAIFAFPDFASRVSAAGVQAVIKNCERDTLVLALTLAKRNAPEVVDHFFDNMSKRVGEQMREDMETAGPVRLKDAQDAQQAVVSLAQSLAKAGEIEITDGDQADEPLLD